jgi:hypothetical protein
MKKIIEDCNYERWMFLLGGYYREQRDGVDSAGFVKR